MNEPDKFHMVPSKRIMRYVNGTLKYGFLFHAQDGEKNMELIDYFNSYWYIDKRDRMSTFAYLFKFHRASSS